MKMTHEEMRRLLDRVGEQPVPSRLSPEALAER